MARKHISRSTLTIVGALVVVGGLVFAFWPRPLLVDIGEVYRGPLMVTIEEEGRTRVRELYIVSTPVDGRLLRVEVHPGDTVQKDTSVVARMLPANPAALDVRTREQARAAVAAAEAALRIAESDLAATNADLDLARTDLSRTQRLAQSGTVSQAALDRALSQTRAAEAHHETALAAIAQRRAELTNAQAQLIGFDDRGLLTALDDQLDDQIPIYAPIDGRILRVIHEDETTLAAGAPILEIGDIDDGLEVVVELISSDAVQVTLSDDVIIRDWGGADVLQGVVTRVEPFGQSKVTALGVEEQRVTVVVQLSSLPDERVGLGHGYRVTAQVVIWRTDDAVIVPSSALFRNAGDWAVFFDQGGTAELRAVSVGKINGLEAQVLDGLSPGDRVVLYPPGNLSAGQGIEERARE